MESPRYPANRHSPEDADSDDFEIALTNTDLHTPTETPRFTATAIEVPGSVIGRPNRITQLGQYRLIRELGAGGMGIVYEAHDTLLNRRVALKVLRPNLPSEQSARERFVREAQAMAAFSHENIVTIYQVGEAHSLSFMAMQLLEGETLEKRLDREGRLSVADAVRIGREVASGLAAAHEKGLIHRDVKPSNIWLETGTDRVKLLDFGLALVRDNTHITNSGFVIGTPSYMSPEQARGETLDGRSDLFSLGTILYRTITGERPFEGSTALAIMRNLELHQPLRVTAKRPDVPAAFSNLIMELLSKDRKDRPASAADAAHRLDRPEMVRPSNVPVAPSGMAPPLAQPVSAGRPPVSGSAPVPTSMLAGQMSGIYPRPDYAPHSSTTIRTLPSDHPQPITRLIVILIGIGLVLTAGWYFIIADFGELSIETDIDPTEVHIRQQGEVKQIANGRAKFELRPGMYEVVLIKPKTGYRVSKGSIEIRRGVHEVIRVNKDGSSEKFVLRGCQKRGACRFMKGNHTIFRKPACPPRYCIVFSVFGTIKSFGPPPPRAA
ncbi:serine/threonine-protein kinase [Zavarzinella formosa]|uniref:serine/threonine-protein kinase n=1 Tax=Zavarzinella formosa TaxID=360055 RepID=UPI0002E4643C|nr:serine/threonine-protein kinase [Zavarzinella formosa]